MQCEENKQQSKSEKIKEELQLAIHGLEVNYHTGNEQGTFRDYIFSTAQGKGQDRLKAELGANNLSFDSANHKITYKGVVFTVLENGDILIDGNGGQGNTGELDWDEIMRTAQKHPDQRNSEDIGIDALGNPVNLDLWDYTSNYLGQFDGGYGWQAYKPFNNDQGNEIYDIAENLTAFFTSWQAIPRTAGGLIRRKNGCKAAVEGCPAVIK